MRNVSTCLPILRTAEGSIGTVSRLIKLVAVGEKIDTMTLIPKGSISLIN
jgi:hypothetical protein